MDMTLEQAMIVLDNRAAHFASLGQGQAALDLRTVFNAIDAHLAQHAAMVAKLRELCLTIRQDDRDIRWCASAIEEILSTEPSDPVKVDVAAVWEVIDYHRNQAKTIRGSEYYDDVIGMRTATRHDGLANKLAVAIGDK